MSKGEKVLNILGIIADFLYTLISFGRNHRRKKRNDGDSVD